VKASICSHAVSSTARQTCCPSLILPMMASSMVPMIGV